MATYTIGSMSRDYLTLEEAEADSYNSDTGAVVLEQYDDSDFTAAVNLTTAGPTSILIKTAAGHECDGAENGGVRYLGVNVQYNIDLAGTLQDFEIDGNSANLNPALLVAHGGNSTDQKTIRMLVHDQAGNSSGNRHGIYSTQRSFYAIRCVAYNCANAGSGPSIGIYNTGNTGTAPVYVIGCTVENCKTNGISIIDNSGGLVKNCVAANNGVPTFLRRRHPVLRCSTTHRRIPAHPVPAALR